jgi:hypothetical protein
VLELEDLEDRPLDLDVVSVFKLVGVDDGRSVLMKPNCDVVAARLGTPGGSITIAARANSDAHDRPGAGEL